MRSRSLSFKIGSSIDSDSNLVDSDLVDSDLVDSDIVDLDLVDSDLNLSLVESCGYPSQLYNVLIFLTSNLDNSSSGLSLKVANFQKIFWLLLKRNAFSVNRMKKFVILTKKTSDQNK
jgi:hypothetical protein